tara:strand:+ start:38 stop:346 length:309 start_codon:yes stop_codon:yes gene_type:complete
MTWRVRGTEDELPILRGLIDEIVCILDMGTRDTDLKEEIKKTIWEANNSPILMGDEKGEPIWWPKHEEIDGDVCLIEETLDENQNRIEMRVLLDYKKVRRVE